MFLFIERLVPVLHSDWSTATVYLPNGSVYHSATPIAIYHVFQQNYLFNIYVMTYE